MAEKISIPNITEKNFPTKTRSAVLTKLHEITMEDTPVKKMGPEDVLVKVMAVGICGSDVEYYDTGRIANWVVKKPLILGHESTGIILATGNKVTKFKKGDRVAMEPGIPCGKCKYCREGKYNLCPYMAFMATPPYDGDLTNYIVWPANFTYKIPDDMSFEVGSLSEPLSVTTHASQVLDIQPGSTVFISGAGPVGLLGVLVTKYFGADKIIISDMEQSRLDVAKKLGADFTINAGKFDVNKEIDNYTNKEGADYALEVSANAHAEGIALHALARGGKIAYIGQPAEKAIPLDIDYMSDHETKVYGILRYENTYPLAIKVLHHNLQKANLLLTDFYKLDQTKAAMERNRTAKSKSLKIIIYPNEKLRDK